jgi:pilus assembly protein CpaF
MGFLLTGSKISSVLNATDAATSVILRWASQWHLERKTWKQFPDKSLHRKLCFYGQGAKRRRRDSSVPALRVQRHRARILHNLDKPPRGSKDPTVMPPPRMPLRQSSDSKETSLEELKQRIHSKLVDKLDLTKVGELEGEILRREIRLVVEHLCDSEDKLLNRSEREQLVSEVLDETFGLGPLELLLKDATISDIMINGPKNIYCERRGKMEKTNVVFRDNDHLMQIIDRIISKVGRRVDETCPMVDARMMDGSRFNAIIPPLALDGACVSIRRFGSNPLRLEDLLNYKAFTPEMVMLLEGAIKARLNIIISGGTGSGKTTLLNTLSSFIANSDRVVTIEDAAELQLQQDHVVRLETRPPNIEGKGAITATDLVKNALRMRPERIIIGECRGAETLDMLQAMNTGHEGSMTTVHANTPRDALSRLETLIMMSGFELPLKAMRTQISSAVNLIVQASRLQGGPRKITYVQDGIDEMGRAFGRFVSTGVRPKFMHRLESAGVRLPSSAFRERVMLED